MVAKTEKFEASLERLEGLAHKLEEGGLSLEESIKVFEEGMKLVHTCEVRLQEAQKKIEILVKEKDGKKTARDFEPEGES